MQALIEWWRRSGSPRTTWLSETPVRFGPGTRLVLGPDRPEVMVAALADALERCWTVFLADPQWDLGMVQGMLDAVQPQLIVGPDRWMRMKARPPETDLIPETASPSRINVPTGGTTGQLKFASHTGRSLEAAALGFLDFFGEDSHVALCALPLYHVSGLMQVVRAAQSNGRWFPLSQRALLEGTLPAFEASRASLSLVPTQLLRLLRGTGARAWLKTLKRVPIGGAAMPPGLGERARDAGIRLAPSYGLTETAAMVAATKPIAFLDGHCGVGDPLPHVEIAIKDDSGIPVTTGVAGRISVKSASLAEGYFGAGPWPSEVFLTEDLGRWDSHEGLRILGRLDGVVTTGGEKVCPDSVESVLRCLPGVEDAFVFGEPHPEWGEQVVAVVKGTIGGGSEPSIAREARRLLARHEVPKRWVVVERIPRNLLGKVDRDTLKQHYGHGA